MSCSSPTFFLVVFCWANLNREVIPVLWIERFGREMGPFISGKSRLVKCYQ